MITDWKFKELDLQGVYAIRPFRAKDDRGRLIKAFSQEIFREYGINFDIQETLLIESKRNVLRGIHFQKEKPVAKLLSCVSGWIYVVVLNIKRDSDDLGKWISCELRQGEQLFIPGEYGLGTYAMEDSSFLCMNGEKMYPDLDDGIKWDDSAVAVKWPCSDLGCKPIVSEKDRNLQSFKMYVENGSSSNDAGERLT